MFADEGLEFLFSLYSQLEDRAFSEPDGVIFDSLAASILAEVEMAYGAEMGKVFIDRYEG